MKLFGRKHVVAYEVIFVPGGEVFTYEKNESEFTELMLGRYRTRGDLPVAVWARYSDGSRARVDLRVSRSA
ncbi:MAG: hypothetical protein ACRDY7_01625 [Acidimicrobiia bacterium]